MKEPIFGKITGEVGWQYQRGELILKISQDKKNVEIEIILTDKTEILAYGEDGKHKAVELETVRELTYWMKEHLPWKEGKKGKK